MFRYDSCHKKTNRAGYRSCSLILMMPLASGISRFSHRACVYNPYAAAFILLITRLCEYLFQPLSVKLVSECVTGLITTVWHVLKYAMVPWHWINLHKLHPTQFKVHKRMALICDILFRVYWIGWRSRILADQNKQSLLSDAREVIFEQDDSMMSSSVSARSASW